MVGNPRHELKLALIGLRPTNHDEADEEMEA